MQDAGPGGPSKARRRHSGGSCGTLFQLADGRQRRINGHPDIPGHSRPGIADQQVHDRADRFIRRTSPQDIRLSRIDPDLPLDPRLLPREVKRRQRTAAATTDTHVPMCTDECSSPTLWSALRDLLSPVPRRGPPRSPHRRCSRSWRTHRCGLGPLSQRRVPATTSSARARARPAG